MKQYNKKSLAAGALLGAAVMLSGVAFAATDTTSDLSKEMKFSNGPHKTQNPEAKAAVEANDFDAFKAAVTGKKAENVTEEKFEKIVALHEAKESGDDEKVAELKAEMKAERAAHKEERKAKRAEVKAAIDAGDYAAFQTLTADRSGDGPEVTEEVFEKLGDLHEAKESGDSETVSEIKAELKELGFERKGKKGGKGGKRGGDR